MPNRYAKAQAPPNAKARGPRPIPVSMRKHTGTHTCDVWSTAKGTGDGGGDSRQQNQRTVETASGCSPTGKAVQQPNEPEPNPLQQPSLSRMHPSNPIAGIGADSVGVREGDRAGNREPHATLNAQPEPKKSRPKNTPLARLATTAQWSPTELCRPTGKMRRSESFSI